jgi:RHS repeat-associated protein
MQFCANKSNQHIHIIDGLDSIMRKQVYSSSTLLQSTTDYIDGLVFTTTGTTTVLSYFAMPEGRVLNNGTALLPEYVITDQQGNARFSFADNGSGGVTIRQENSFYPTGENLAATTVPLPPPSPAIANINLYNGGSEWQNEFNNLLDYHQTFFRNYDPAIGRFISSDPDPESAKSMSTYQYGGKDPVMMNDPMGNYAPDGYTDLQWQLQQEIWSEKGHNRPHDVSQYDNLTNGDNGVDLLSDAIKYSATSSLPTSGPDFQTLLNTLIKAFSNGPVNVYSDGITYNTHVTTTMPNPFYPSQPGSPGTSPTFEKYNLQTHFVPWSAFSDFLVAAIQNNLDNSPGDVSGISFHANVVDGIGGGITASAFYIIRGQYKEFYVSGTASARAGFEDGVSLSIFIGNYWGQGDPDPNTLLGGAVDYNMTFGEKSNSAYGCWSFSEDPFKPSWTGFGYSFGPDVGGSAGIGVSFSIYGFPKKQ